MKKVFLALLFLFATQTTFAQSEPTPTPATELRILVMRVFEPHTIGIGQPMILLTYGPGRTEEILLKKVNKDNAAFNAEVLQKTMERIKNEGYVLMTATGGDFFSTYIFEKK
jgi:hypothetical protein